MLTVPGPLTQFARIVKDEVLLGGSPESQSEIALVAVGATDTVKDWLSVAVSVIAAKREFFWARQSGESA